MFIENVITGLIILLAISSISLSLGIVTLLSTIIGTGVAKLGGAEEKSIKAGLHGFNPVLTGLALMLFLNGPYQWIIALIGAALAAVVNAAMLHLMRNTDIPVLTLPYIIVSWLVLLSSYKLQAVKLSPNLAPQNLSHWQLDIAGEIDLVQGSLNGIGQIFFLHTILSGVLLFVAIFWAGWRFGLFAIIGNSVSLLTAYTLGAERTLIYLGLYGYNAILTILAVSVIFKTSTNRYAMFTGVIGAALTVPITASLATLLIPFGLPVFTMPFVISTWLILFARKVLPNF